MKKLMAICLLVCAAAFVAACSQGGASTPVAPQTSNLTASSNLSADASQASNPTTGSSATSVSTQSRSNDYVLVCHNNVDGDDGDPAWVVISVNSTSVPKHCDNHGDFAATICSNFCDLSGFAVGDDCSSCVPI
jgi:hypothetical protein